MGCVQTLNVEEEISQKISILVRFESDTVRDKVLQLDGSEVEGSQIRVSSVLREDNGLVQPVVLDEPKEIADCLGRRFAFISSENFGDPRFREHKERAEREKLDFKSKESNGYNSAITLQELEYALNLAKDSSPGPDEVSQRVFKELATSVSLP